MTDALKFDVRVRERLLKKGLLTEAEVEQHLAQLADRTDDATEIGIKQPALQSESEREVLVVRTFARPAQPVPPPRAYGDDDEAYADEAPVDDEDDDEDEDEDEKKEAPAEGAAESPDRAAEQPAEDKPKPSVDDDWG